MVDCKYIDLKERGVEKIPVSINSRYLISRKWSKLFVELSRGNDTKRTSCYMSIILPAIDLLDFFKHEIFHDFGIRVYIDEEFELVLKIDEYLLEIRSVVIDKFIETRDFKYLDKKTKEIHDFAVSIFNTYCKNELKDYFYHENYEKMKKILTW